MRWRLAQNDLWQECAEAGATVRTNTSHRDTSLCVPTYDARAIEVLASGLPLHHGAQLAVDITLKSAMGACGGPENLSIESVDHKKKCRMTAKRGFMQNVLRAGENFTLL